MIASVVGAMREVAVTLALAAMIVAALGVLVGVVEWMYKRHL